MPSVFKEKNAKIIAIEPSGAVRQLLTDVLRSKGFESIQGVGSFKDALSILEVDSAHWIICSLTDEQDANALQLLNILSQQATLRGVRLTLFVAEEEVECTPFAYERGLMSTLSKPCNKQSLSEAVDSLMKSMEKHQWDTTRLAATNLSECFKTSNNFKDQVMLYRNLLDLYPGDCDYYAALITPYIKGGEADKARSAFKQAALLGLSNEKTKAIIQEVFHGDAAIEADIKEDSAFNALGIQSCVIVEPDQSTVNVLEKILKKLGLNTIHTFPDGEAAWQWLDTNSEPELIIQEWRIPKLTGPYFLQRVRQRFPCVPIITVSSLITAEDVPLAKEMGVAAIIDKPFDRVTLIKTLVQTIQKDRLPNDAETIETKIRQHIDANHLTEAKSLWEKYKNISDIPVLRKTKMEAEIAFINHQYEKARDLTVKAITTQADSVHLLNLLAKCMMKLNDHQAALRCYTRAQSMSPMNVQRLCAIAEVNAEMGDSEASKEALDEAKSKDAGSESVAESSAKISISSGNSEAAKKIMSELHSLQKVISYMNNRAISHARMEQFDESFNLYKKTLESIPENKNEYKAAVNYNLALAYARKDLFEDTVKQLDVALSFGESKIKNKANSLRLKIERAIEKGISLRFHGSTAVLEDNGEEAEANKHQKNAKEIQDNEKNDSIVSSVEATPGELCCFRLYHHTLPPSSKLNQLITKKALRFKPREAIAREATGGVDKTLKADTSSHKR